MHLLDPSTYRKMPWKNGRGTTEELFVRPAGADLDSFEVRVSIARVEADGAFSSFPGIDRTMVVLEGKGMSLHLSDDFSVQLGPTSPPFAFTADDPCTSKLLDGPITDFNVMTRRKVLRHRVTRVAFDGEESLTCTGELSLLMVLSGMAVARDGVDVFSLKARDVLTVGPGEPLIRVSSDAPLELVLVDLWRR